MVNQLIIDCIRIASLVAISLLLTFAYPMFLIIFFGQKQILVPVILPFVDLDTSEGYYLNIAHQVLFGIFGPCAILGIELTTCVNKNATMVAVDVIRSELEELENNLRKSSQFNAQRAQEFRNILIQVQDFHRFSFRRFLLKLDFFLFVIIQIEKEIFFHFRYITCITDLYYWKLFIQPPLLIYAVSVGVFLYVKVRIVKSIQMTTNIRFNHFFFFGRVAGLMDLV